MPAMIYHIYTRKNNTEPWQHTGGCYTEDTANYMASEYIYRTHAFGTPEFAGWIALPAGDKAPLELPTDYDKLVTFTLNQASDIAHGYL